MKKIISLLMALIFVFSMAAPSFAATAANEAVYQASDVNGGDEASSSDDFLGNVVDVLNQIWTKIVDFFKSLFGFGFNPGTYNVTYYTDETKTEILYVKPTQEGSELEEVAVPTRVGYTFKSWEPALPSVMPDEDVEVYATWSIKTVTLKFDTGKDGIKVSDINTTFGELKVLPGADDAEKEVLIGWKDPNTDKVYKPGEVYEAIDNVTFVAVWGVKGTTITFDLDGGSWANKPYEGGKYDANGNFLITAPVGTVVPTLADPEKTGYKFEGWDGVIPAKQPSEDRTYTAVWTPLNITTTWKAKDGTVLNTQTTKCGEKLSPKVSPVPEAGYKFIGWKSNIDGVVYSSFPIATPAVNTIFTAEFEAIEYSYVFKGENGAVLASGKAPCGDTVAVPAAPDKSGYTFNGWADATDTVKIYANATTFEMQAGDAVYTATYVPNAHTITWNAAGGKVNGKASDVTNVAYGSAIIAPTEISKAGYVFVDWTPSIPATMPDENLTFTATWTEAGDTPYAVETYTMDTKGEYVKTSESKQGVTGAAVTLTPESKEGFTLNETSSILSGVIAADGKTVLKVYYDRNKYNVIINGETKQYYYGETIKAPAAAEKEGNTFKGWKGSDGKLYAAGADVTVPAQDGFTLTAEFTPNKYSITFKVNDTVYQTLTFDYDAEIILPADPIMADKYFEGWTPALPSKMPANNLTVSANFVAATTHKVTFHANGHGSFEVKDLSGNTIESVQTHSINVRRGDKINCPDAPKCEAGYRFVGWATFKEGGLTEKDVLFKGIEDAPKMTYSQDIFFYAVYVVPTCEVTYILDGSELTDYTSTVETGNTVDPSKVVPEEKIGYEFSGWKILTINGKEVERDKDGKLTEAYKNYKDDSAWTTCDTDESVVYVGNYVAREHDVVFNAGVGHWAATDAEGNAIEETVKTVKTKFNTLIEVPAAPVAPYGMKFLGWAAKENSDKVVTIGTLTDVAKDAEGNISYTADKVYNYYAVYVIDIYELKFVEYNNTVTLEKKYSYGETINVSSYLAKIPDREGYAVNEEKPFNPAVPTSVTLDSITEYNKNEGFVVKYEDREITDSYGNVIEYKAGVLTFVVQYDVLSYKVFFSGCDYETMEIPYNTLLSDVIADPETYGRTFAGWYVINADGQKVPFDLTTEYMPAEKEGITLYAEWTNNPYTIKFVDQDGTALYDEDNKVIEQINGRYGDPVKAPNAPVKTGYTFDGWDIKIPATIEKDLTIKATWKANTYTVSFDTNGGQPAKIDSLNADFGTQVKLPANPTKTGHTFLGWDYTEGNTDNFIDKSATTFDMTACDITLKARWQINQYTIKFVTGNGTPINAITADYSTPIKVVTEWAGHTYTWSPALPETMPDKDMTVTAVWECIEADHKVYFHPVDKADDPETVKDESFAVAVTYKCKENGGAAITVPSEADFLAVGYSVETGKKIGGWKDAEGNAVTFAEALTTDKNGSHYYVSEYVWADYTLTFDTDGGSEVASVTYKYKDAIAEPTAPTKLGYTFAGWFNEKGNAVDFETATMPASDMTYTAKWTPNKYFANWDNDGNVTSVEYEFGAVINLPEEPTRFGYTFGGWTNCETDNEYEDGVTMPVGGITFYAIWNPIPHNATFDPNGGAFDDEEVTGSQPFTKTINYGTALNAPALADRKGYTFAGWVDKASKQPMPANMPNNDVVFYAVWVGVDGIAYTVNTYTMDTEGNYGEADAKVYSGVTGETVDYTDYQAPAGFKVADRSNLTDVIKADGSLVINIYLERNQYKLIKVVDGKKEETKYYFDSTIAVPALPEKTNDTVYTGWNWSYTLGGEAFTTKPEKMPACDVTVTAANTPRLYTVSFMSAGSSFVSTKQYEYNTVVILADLGTPAVTGKKFLYWSLTDKGTATTTVTVNADNIKVWAVWESLKYTASFYAEDGTTLLNTATITYGTSITYTPPAREGYTFAGWVIDGKDSITSTMPAQDVKLIARWTANA